jgi:xylulokinase
VQAVLEGICFSFRANLEQLEQLAGQPIDNILAIGGATRNPLWMQLKADIAGRDLSVLGLDEAVVCGAAALAGVAAGCFPDSSSAAASVAGDAVSIHPDVVRSNSYTPIYRAFRKMAPLLQEVHRDLRQASG